MVSSCQRYDDNLTQAVDFHELNPSASHARPENAGVRPKTQNCHNLALRCKRCKSEGHTAF